MAASSPFSTFPQESTARRRLLTVGKLRDHFIYREYTPEDLARAAYSQNLVYPKESTTIRYRDIAITVIEAGNERLRYVVQADGLK